MDEGILRGLYRFNKDRAARARGHFEVDAENIVVATLKTLADRGEVEASVVEQAINEFGLDPNRIDPARA